MTMTREQPTRCAICGTSSGATELYPSTFRAEHLTPEVFSARRSADRVHGRVVRCDRCGLVRSDPSIDPATLADLYGRSSFDYRAELTNLRRTYGRYLSRLVSWCGERPSYLDVGCGNGFALAEALRQGFGEVAGIEPAADAIAAGDPELRPRMVQGMLEPGVFPDGCFDALSLFQVFDHLPDPGALLDVCRSILRPGGVMLLLNHDVTALSARVLRERSPIIDIEHPYLYSPPTLARLCREHGFQPLESGRVWNDIRLGYLARLVPRPTGRQNSPGGPDRAGWLARRSLRLPLGNLYLIVRSPGRSATGTP